MKNYLAVFVTFAISLQLFMSPVRGFAPEIKFSGNLNINTDSLQFFCKELLGRPTSNSVTIHACTNKSLYVYYEYGTDSLNYLSQTGVQNSSDSIPFVFTLGNLNPDTQYFYRMRYRETGTSAYLSRISHSFHTQRLPGGIFSFAIQADPHLDTNSNPAVYTLTLQNILSKKPDFLIDLGDTFMSEKLAIQNPVTIRDRHLLLRSYFDIVCHSVPLFLVLGNHEGELGWRLDSTANNLPVWATNARKFYYPNPEPNLFYSGDTIAEPYVGLRQNYYSWTWGNALFIVLDPFWYTKSKPGWGWTLGSAQYNWFKNVITTSNAKFKFFFCHNLVGGNSSDARGGTEVAHLFEMGGRNADSTWGFDTYRPGWGKPIHTLMAENKATFFHGHDHFFGFQMKDGVVYQEVPQPSSKSYTQISASQYGYVNGVFIPNRGYLSVTVTSTSAKVEYIRTYLPAEENTQRHNGDVSYSYTIDTSGSVVNVKEFYSVPDKFSLEQNYPNPFNPGTTIRFSIQTANNVQLKVYDMTGKEITTLVNEYRKPGTYTVSFDSQRFSLSSGIYFYRITSGNYTECRKMILIK
ncbi:MAG: T9SS type A sorting domain-containing protein [Ignavibacteriae bacterium]|nr:T9SS type A sorting domain-containing protein [Ignavibacteriota bacterium]